MAVVLSPYLTASYDKEGLLPFVERSGGGMRMFKNEDMSWLKTIECLKKNRYADQGHQTLYGLLHGGRFQDR